MSIWLYLLSPALAGSGPWTLSEGTSSVYVGIYNERLERLAGAEGARATSVVDVDDGIETTGFSTVFSHGVRDDVELELDVGWTRVAANRRGGAVCSSLGPTTCRTTTGLAPLRLQAKWQVLDEFRNAPFTLSLGAAARFSQWTSATRDRITNLGEGTTDYGPTLAVGRSGPLGQGYWSANLDGQWLYRQPNVVDADPPVPGSETSVDFALFAGTRAWWSIGPTVSYWERPRGIDLDELLSSPELASDMDRFARLRARTVRVGGKLLVRSSEQTTLVVGAWATPVAVNNPMVMGLSAGASFYPRPPDAGAD